MRRNRSLTAARNLLFPQRGVGIAKQQEPDPNVLINCNVSESNACPLRVARTTNLSFRRQQQQQQQQRRHHQKLIRLPLRATTLPHAHE